MAKEVGENNKAKTSKAVNINFLEFKFPTADQEKALLAMEKFVSKDKSRGLPYFK
ncbi:hypothetical protein ACKGJN_04455 [Gillisia sp. Q332]|uniref:hypothetical protein n=1 Tax=Gillisia xinjiangensis TaxID=3384765 RepID=UPI00391CC844